MATVGVLGSTGAVGREVVREASHAPEVGRVVAFLRRDAAPAELFPGADVAKVEARVVEFGRLRAADFEGLGAVFCCLGEYMRPPPRREERRTDLLIYQ